MRGIPAWLQELEQTASVINKRISSRRENKLFEEKKPAELDEKPEENDLNVSDKDISENKSDIVDSNPEISDCNADENNTVISNT